MIVGEPVKVKVEGRPRLDGRITDTMVTLSSARRLGNMFTGAIESARQREAAAPVARTLDDDEAVRRTFGRDHAEAIIRLAPQLEARKREGREVPEAERTFATDEGKRWVLHSWDDMFGYNFAAYP